jgi:hypothetical protein
MLGNIARERTSVAARTRPVWLGLCVWLALSSSARSVLARERAFALAWSAPAECPDSDTVASYVEEDVGEIAYGPTALRARGTVSQSSDGRYSVLLEFYPGGEQTSKRSLEGGSCQAVSQAAALVVALAIRAQATPSVRPVAPVPGAPSRSAHERPFLASQVIADLGSLPGPAVGLGISGGVTFSGFRVEPRVGYFAPRTATIERSGLGARFTLGTAGARVCTPFPRSEWWFAPCVGGGVDWVRAQGFGALRPRDASAWAALMSASAVAGWDVSPIISLRLELEGVVPLARPEFEVDGVGEVFRRAPLALRGNLGLELHF